MTKEYPFILSRAEAEAYKVKKNRARSIRNKQNARVPPPKRILTLYEGELRLLSRKEYNAIIDAEE